MSSSSISPRCIPWELVLVAMSLAIHGTRALLHSHDLVGDELRYVQCAKNITQGFLVPDDNPDFVNGPGYPAVLAPFLALDVPWRWARVLNAGFIAGAVLLIFRTVKHYAGLWWAVTAALFVLLHPNTMRITPQLLTEPLSLFCVSAFSWGFCLTLRRENWRSWAVFTGFALAWLVLTRVMFGHVMVVMLLLCAVMALVLRSVRPAMLRSLAVLALGLTLCVPYLLHTRAKTGKLYCWSTNSGDLLYWMTSTNPGENGYWFDYKDAMTHRDLAPHHREFFERISNMKVLEREAAFMEQVKKHLAANPKGVVMNWVCNTVRLVVGFPRSHRPEELSTLAIIAWNGPLALLALGAVLLVWRQPSSLPPELWFLGVFAWVYLGGSTLASSLARYFLVVAPLLLLVSAVVWRQNVHIELISREDKNK